MKPTEETSNPFLKQVSKLFEDLSAGQKEKPPISPRITCTRLRRLREIRCELVETADASINAASQNELEATVAQLNAARTKNESFATWVLRNRQAHKEFSDVQNQLRGQTYTNGREDQKSNNAFSNFSPAALQKVARNFNTPPSTLKWLAAHYRAEVRQAVATNANADVEIMTMLAGDAEEGVRIVLAGNPSLTRSVLLKLCDDPSPLVSEKAKNILYEQSKSAISQKTGENPIVVKRPAEANPVKAVFPEISSENTLCETGHSANAKSKKELELIEREFLQVIAEKSTTPPRRLAELAVHPDKIIRGIIAANPNSTPEILWQLAKDESMDVRRKLLGNYNCPEEIINHLMRK
jgi:hypothetical protein